MAMDPHAMTRTMTPSQHRFSPPLTWRHRRPFSATRPCDHRRIAAQQPRSRASEDGHAHASHLQNGAGSNGASANGASLNGASTAAQPLASKDALSTPQVSSYPVAAPCISLQNAAQRCMEPT